MNAPDKQRLKDYLDREIPTLSVQERSDFLALLETFYLDLLQSEPGLTLLEELHLPDLYYRRLQRRGFKTVEQLCSKTYKELYCYRNIGSKCLSQVQEALAKMDLKLAGE